MQHLQPRCRELEHQLRVLRHEEEACRTAAERAFIATLLSCVVLGVILAATGLAPLAFQRLAVKCFGSRDPSW